MQNAVKYADPGRVAISLSLEEGTLRFEVADDGAGFDPATTPHGAGTQNMIDRLEALGGSVTIRSAPGRGTTVTGEIPAGPAGREEREQVPATGAIPSGE